MFRMRDLVRVFDTTIILPISETAELSFPFEEANAAVKILFKDSSEDPSQVINLSDDKGAVLITFNNWTNSLGTALIEPVEFATSSRGTKLLMLATSWRIGTVNRLDFQVFVGEK